MHVRREVPRAAAARGRSTRSPASARRRCIERSGCSSELCRSCANSGSLRLTVCSSRKSAISPTPARPGCASRAGKGLAALVQQAVQTRAGSASSTACAGACSSRRDVAAFEHAACCRRGARRRGDAERRKALAGVAREHEAQVQAADLERRVAGRARVAVADLDLGDAIARAGIEPPVPRRRSRPRRGAAAPRQHDAARCARRPGCRAPQAAGRWPGSRERVPSGITPLAALMRDLADGDAALVQRQRGEAPAVGHASRQDASAAAIRGSGRAAGNAAAGGTCPPSRSPCCARSYRCGSRLIGAQSTARAHKAIAL